MKESVFFIAAHPDDLIGAAGAALLLAESGRYALHVVDLTRGELGLSGRGFASEECASLRVEEEKRACAMLGVAPEFLGETDGDAFASRECCGRLAGLFAAASPRAVFTHWPVDRHVDHIICHAVTMKALNMAGINPEVYFYEESVQTIAMPAHVYLPFDRRIMERKTELVRMYACQNEGDAMAQRKLCEARYHGWKAGADFAECFGAYRTPGTEGRTIFFDLANTRQAEA